MNAVPIATTLPGAAFRNRETLERSSVIRQVALRALKELALALAITLICLPFTASGAWVVMGSIAMAGIAVNAIIHWATIYIFRSKIDRMLGLATRSGIFFFSAGTHGSTLIHESGHCLMANRLFQSRAKIQLFPFEGGCTSYSARTMTSIGQKLGYRRSTFLITLAGPALAILAATISLIAGLALRTSHPEAASLCIGFALFVFFGHAKYAYSGLSAPLSELGHDFVRLKAFGIHPLAACAAIVAIPIIIIAGYAIGQYLKANPASSETAVRTGL
ncbi:MAG: hypothetical protein HW387_1075 [Parachlamydiales bacterium]|nr:hypothetical protein [Parachlamydiales bacterium]